MHNMYNQNRGVTRRTFLARGSASVALASLPAFRPSAIYAAEVNATHTYFTKEYALRAVDAARAAGATYADARLTHTWRREFYGNVQDREEMAIGVRALFNGYWGFSSSAYWSADEADRLGREAVEHAKVGALGKERIAELGTIPVVRNGEWTMPVEIDPFTVPVEEVLDYLVSVPMYATARPFIVACDFRCIFYKQRKIFASSEGSSYEQTVYRTGGDFSIKCQSKNISVVVTSDLLSPAGKGWEHIRKAPLREEIPWMIEQANQRLSLPVSPVMVGRYNIIFDAAITANLLSQTIGTASELDRALGQEANAGGTAYLNDPASMLGKFQVASPLVTVTGNRSVKDGAATVKWDDEGVSPRDFTIVRDGVLTDYQTTREAAFWIADWYRTRTQPVQSNGCAAAPSALEVSMLHTPNLQLVPAKGSTTMQDLIQDTERGLAIRGGNVTMDFQSLNGLGIGTSVVEIQKGKITGQVPGLGFLFRAPEFWKSVTTVCGSPEVLSFDSSSSKGEPMQMTSHSVAAVPVKVSDVAVIDIMRKA